VTSPLRRQDARRVSPHQQESEPKMDMKQFAGTDFIKLKDLQSGGPRQEVIADCRPGNFDMPDLFFESGSVLTLNATSVRVLIRAYGDDSRGWVAKTIRIYPGQVPFKDGITDAALVEPISPATSGGKQPKPNTGGTDFNDEVRF
jgi:hypothetical protein